MCAFAPSYVDVPKVLVKLRLVDHRPDVGPRLQRIINLQCANSRCERRYELFMDAIRERKALATCVEISRDVMSGAYYKALVKCRTLFDFEQERLSYGSAGVSKSTARG